MIMDKTYTLGCFQKAAVVTQRRLELCKILASCLFFTSFFLQTNSIWFVLTISSLIGCSHYLLSETQPQLMMIISVIVTYQKNRIFEKIKRWFALTNMWTIFSPPKDDKVMLQSEDNFSSIVYYENKGKNRLKKYIYLFNEKLRSNDLIIFKDEYDNDITDDIEPYLGPMQNFHGSILTPADFNHKQIKVFRDGEISLCKTFNQNDALILS